MSDGSDTIDGLEQRVAELEATVRGLTEELVDATERVRELERESGTYETTEEKRARRQRETVKVEEHTDSIEEHPEGDTTKTAEGESSDDAEVSTSDDIIVA
jgi:peptidoglycan hydrolase CwlO-like protein